MAAAETGNLEIRNDRRLRALYRRELRQSVRWSAFTYSIALAPSILVLMLVHPSPIVAAIDGLTIALALAIAYLARRRGRRYVVQLGMLLGCLAMAASVTAAVAAPELATVTTASCAMIPLAVALFIPLERAPHRVWLVLANATIAVEIAVLGRNDQLLASLPQLVSAMAVSTVLSAMANELLVRRREASNRQMVAVRGLYTRMQDREQDLRRQDEFLMMQQETLVVQQAELLRLNEELETIARIDALTGLGNRLRLNEDLAQLAGRIERAGGSAGLLLLDLDRFKRLNDTCGHLAGDAALKGVAEVLRRTARVGDGLYRYGGEEFLIVLHDCDEPALELAGQRYITAVQAAGMAHPDNQPWGVVTTSAGAAELSQRTGVDVDAGLRAADEALYQAKARGRNRLEVHVCHEPDIVQIDRARAAS